MKHVSQKNNKGFAILIGVLVSSVLLSLGLVLFGIGQKQITLSSLGRDSQIALYAADSGLECALFYDLSSSLTGSQFSTSTAGTVRCAGLGDPRVDDPTKTVTSASINTAAQVEIRTGTQVKGVNGYLVNSIIGGHPTASSTFQVNFANKSCVIVEVKKSMDDTNPDPIKRRIVHTRILAHGYNTCDTTSPLRLERGLEVYYPPN